MRGLSLALLPYSVVLDRMSGQPARAEQKAGLGWRAGSSLGPA